MPTQNAGYRFSFMVARGVPGAAAGVRANGWRDRYGCRTSGGRPGYLACRLSCEGGWGGRFRCAAAHGATFVRKSGYSQRSEIPSTRELIAMIRMPGVDLLRAVKLLQQHHPHQPMRPGRTAKP